MQKSIIFEGFDNTQLNVAFANGWKLVSMTSTACKKNQFNDYCRIEYTWMTVIHHVIIEKEELNE